MELESRGVVGVMVASTEFEKAAAVQAKALGGDPAVVFVPHPIQDRTDEEMRNIASEALETILNMIVAGA